MTHLSRPARSLAAAGLVLALGGCAVMDGSTTTTAQAPAASAMGGGSSGFMRAGLEAFSLSNCMKYEATPRECEPVILRGEQ